MRQLIFALLRKIALAELPLKLTWIAVADRLQLF
jgi:hypothetical protein